MYVILVQLRTFSCWHEFKFLKIVLRSILGSKTEQRTGDWRQLHNEELYNLYSLPLISPMRARCPAHLIIRDLIILIIFVEQYKLWELLIMQFYSCSLYFIPSSCSQSPSARNKSLYLLNEVSHFIRNSNSVRMRKEFQIDYRIPSMRIM
jgi:hypothetical protein